jgi:hypothetical protein
MAAEIVIPYDAEVNRALTGSPAWGRDKYDETVLFRCQCGAVLLVNPTVHAINGNGRVSPSLHHWDERRQGLSKGCGFHVYGVFDGWDTEPAGAAMGQPAPGQRITQP